MNRLILESFTGKLKTGESFTEYYIQLEGNNTLWSKGDTIEEAFENFKKQWKTDVDFQLIISVDGETWKDYFTNQLVNKPIR